ncbi:hypothetical protein BFJ63_vAg3322 [Fusarium oxysporum f. sp. narcissi]|uniref:Uncharacterized protein n=3 Tax=Fusarium oxysporum TaxID=5507 RepID=A0A2H3HPS1_FUSOX|nr:hypothetical protein AU210_006856 [Fusarium oxysporum f. sp. radicis-cucumerinum]RKK23070.1 hypothetical protein BFJ65_g5648 [Fusarium oxysporum f. sp. cepae]RKL33324.1 hypothetical protein BFJ70_g8695 [Fusarium oxysporum]RYC94023.1 hypothetical protein BFJ63_vAg3322 [Fusarium oxysporum f. sp. narcissi]RKK49349.1 hypothetical protein BFJ67_g6884 [Fusarium oxysporum f. sp. cepae]
MFNHYLSLERDGHTLEALRLANELVEEEGLNLYHAAHLHMKMARFPEAGVYHATMAVKILTQLKGTDESIADQLQEAWQVLLERQNVELLENGGTENREAIRQHRYNEYFSKLEQERQSRSEGTDTDERNPLFNYPAKKGRTADSGGEKEKEKEEKESKDLYEEPKLYFAM